MKIIAVKFENYRNLKNGIITPCEGVNVIYGDNAQGKTNLLEALWLFCGGHSFRGAKDNEAVQFGKNFARLDMRFFGQEREQTASILIKGNKKQVEINGVKKNSAASLIERYCAVVFSPEHLSLIKRGPSERRKFIDSAICREKLKNAVAAALPVSPAYFPAGQWTDRWERFYAAEFIREQIFLLYEQEIPYSTYVEVEKFTENLGDKNFIRAIIHVERESQKPIIIGKGGSMIAKLREQSQKRIEEFLGRKYRVELNVVVSPDWRNNKAKLEEFGYIDKDPREM